MIRRLVMVMAAALVVGLSLSPLGGVARAQESANQVGTLIQAELPAGALPLQPAFVRLLRINLAPGASSPNHTHPGVEIGLVETGTVTVQVKGSATLSRPSDTEATPGPSPADSEFEISAGDQIVYQASTEMTFRNSGSDPASILTIVILPAGNQHPEGVTYVDGVPSEDAFAGITPDILGDGVATIIPTGPSKITLERVQVKAGEKIEGSAWPVMLSVESGPLDFRVDGGKIQVSRFTSPGPQADLAPRTEITMAKGDALFAPVGLTEISREGTTSDLTMLRLTIEATDDTTVMPTDGSAKVTIIAEPQTKPEASPSATSATATPESSPEAGASDTFKVGDVVTVIDDGTRLRSSASSESEDNIIDVYDAGTEFEITGPAEDDGSTIWWPVALVADPTLTGYIAEDLVQK